MRRGRSLLTPSPEAPTRPTVPDEDASGAALQLNAACAAFDRAGLNLDELLVVMTGIMATHIGHAGVISLVSDDGHWLQPRAAFHVDAGREAAFRAAALGVREPVATVGTALNVRPAPVIHLLPGNRGERAATLRGTACPMHVGGSLVGTIACYRDGRRPRGDELALLRALAERAAPVINNAHLHQQLDDQERRLAMLTDQILLTQEAERRLVALDIHDGLAQVAASTYQHLEALASHLTCDPADLADLERTQELAKRTIHEARRVIVGLRPTVLDDFGLSTALAEAIRELREAGFSIVIDDSTAGHRWPRAVEVALFRIAQESLANIRKHAGLTTVRMSLSHHDGRLRLEIQDFGRGFDTRADVPSPGPGERVGLAGIRERLLILGGMCSITSHPDQGTCVVVDLPVKPHVGGAANFQPDGSDPWSVSRFGADR